MRQCCAAQPWTVHLANSTSKEAHLISKREGDQQDCMDLKMAKKLVTLPLMLTRSIWVARVLYRRPNPADDFLPQWELSPVKTLQRAGVELAAFSWSFFCFPGFREP